MNSVSSNSSLSTYDPSRGSHMAQDSVSNIYHGRPQSFVYSARRPPSTLPPITPPTREFVAMNHVVVDNSQRRYPSHMSLRSGPPSPSIRSMSAGSQSNNPFFKFHDPLVPAVAFANYPPKQAPAHPINANMNYTMRRRELGEEEQRQFSGSSSGSNPPSGLVPFYYSPNIDSLSAFPYKNSLTPAVLSKTVSWNSSPVTSDDEGDSEQVDDNDSSLLLHQQDESMVEPGRVYSSGNIISHYLDRLSILPIPKQDIIPEVMNWRTKYKRDNTVPSLLRSGGAGAHQLPGVAESPEMDTSIEVFEPNKEANVAAGFPVVPQMPYSRRRDRDHLGADYMEIKSYGYGLPRASRAMSRTLLLSLVLFPPLWLLMATGFFDPVVGQIPSRDKMVALVLGISVFLIAIICMCVGLGLA